MPRSLVYIIGVVFLSNLAFAQEVDERVTTKTDSSSSFARNAVYLELFGPGILHSLNYERLIFTGDHMRIRARIGFTPIVTGEPSLGGFLPSKYEAWAWVFPVGISFEYAHKHLKKKSNFEQGVYLSWILREIANFEGRDYYNSRLYAAFQIAGFRLQPRIHESGLFMRLGIGVMISLFEVYYNDFIKSSEWPLLPLFSWQPYLLQQH